MGKVRLESDGGVCLLLLDDPDRRNAIDDEMRRDLAAAIATVKDDPDVRVLVVAGAGSSFCAGADLPALFGDTSRSVAQIRRDLHTVYACFLSLLAVPIPTIAAVQGPAVGAGLNLAMACDVRIAGPDALFSASFSRIGLHPGGGCTWFLVRALGYQQALSLLLGGGTVRGEATVSRGLALALEPDPRAAALALARRWAELDPNLARDITLTARTAVTSDFDTLLEIESWAQASSATGPGIQAAVDRFRKPTSPSGTKGDTA